MNILKTFKDEKTYVLDKLDLLYESIQNLHYEGKMSLQKNIRIINQTVQHLKPVLENHTNLDEKVIFPFATTHIPIVDPMINFLRAERNEFIAQLETFEGLLRENKQKKKSTINYILLEKLREKGTYMICIVRNHMQAEIEGIYKVLDEKLSLFEKRELHKLIRKQTKNVQLCITGKKGK